MVTSVSIVSVALVSQSALAGNAEPLIATRAELRNGQLRIEGRGAAPGGSVVIASSTTSAASARLGVDGAFKSRPSTSPHLTAG
jgi:hypothetical protein